MSRCAFVVDGSILDGLVLGSELIPDLPADRRCVLDDGHWDDPHRVPVPDGFIEFCEEEDLSWLRRVNNL